MPLPSLATTFRSYCDTSSMDLDRARYLVSDPGRAALTALDPRLSALDANKLSAALRKAHAPNEAAALAEQVTLRAKARQRFGDDFGLLFTPAGLEMMTHPLVAARRAQRLAQTDTRIVDLTCGLGGDLRACLARSMPGIGLERDAPTALLARANLPAATIVRGDAAHPPFDLARSAIIIDPSRRSAAGRRFDPNAFSPNWDTALALLQSARAGVMKAPPGIEHGHIPGWAEAEFVQLGRSMREAAIWAGDGVEPGLRRAVLLPSGAILDSNAPEVPPTPMAPAAFVFDPESCVTRAGVVRQLAHVLGARMLDTQVAYLTADKPAFHVMAATFEVLDILPFSVARLKQRLRERHWRPDEIRRRAFPVEPDELRRLLGHIEGDPVTLLLTTLAGKRTVIIAQRQFELPENCAGV